MKVVGSIIAILTLFGILFGTYQYMESRYALAQEMKKIEQRLDYKILSDQLKAIQQRMWTIQDRFINKKMDTTTNEEMRSLEQDKRQIQEKIDIMEKK